MRTLNYRDWFMSVAKLSRVARRTFRDAWPTNRGLIVRSALLAIVGAALPYGTYWFYSRTVGALANPATAKLALWWVWGAVVIILVSDLVRVLNGLSVRQFYHRMSELFTLQFWSKKAGLGIDQLENPDFRDLVAKAQDRDVWPILNTLEGQFQNLNNAVRLSVALVIVAVYDWRLCLLVCAALVPQFLVDVRHGRTLWSIFDSETDTRRRYQELRRHFQSRFHLTELKLFQNIHYFHSRMAEMLAGFRHSQEVAEKKKYLRSAGAVVVSVGLIGAVMIIIVNRVAHGEMALASFIFIWSSVNSLHATLSSALYAIAQQNEWALHASDVYAVMDASPEIDKLTGKTSCSDVLPEIVFENVSFRYPWDPADRLVLKNVSLRIAPGERTAFVGVNGAGKTTLIKLLCGIYTPTEGRILVNGTDLREIDIESWRARLATLSQNYAHYQLPVREAISIGNTGIEPTEERVREAARAGGADTFIEELPQGYDTMIGKDFTGGVDLSGGQVQRMALSRVFYRGGRVIVLDEPTASLDALAEAQIFEEIEHWPRTSSVILITHRFSSIRNADHIVVLDHGQVVEEGNHEQLMKHSGMYAEMFQKQARGYLEEAEAVV